MTDPGEALQKAVAARLLADAGVTAIVADSPRGRAVFVPPKFPDVWPRITIEPPQVLPRNAGCIDGSECFPIVHCWAKGPDCTLVAGRLAGRVREAMKTPLAIEGHDVIGQYFVSSRPVGDPTEGVEHVVSTFRVLTSPAA